MTDQPDWPGWAPPGGEGRDRNAAGARSDGTEDAHAAHDDVEPTDQIPVPGHAPPHEQTQQLPTDPPPPPPPPGSTQPSAWPPPPAGQPAYGAGGWSPPPPRRRTGLVIAIVVGVLLLMLVAVVVLGVLLFSSTSTTTSTSGPEPVPDGVLPPGLEGPDDREEASQVPADDVQAQSEAVLETINASEERMLAFQQLVFEAIGEDGNVGDAAAEIAREAQDAGDDITQIRSDLRALAGGEADEFEGLRDIRDTYADHMDAWIAYLDAVAGSPALAAPQAEDAAPLWREIEVTGNDFVAAVETGLPEDLPADLQDLAEFIVERGFGGFDDGPTGDVV